MAKLWEKRKPPSPLKYAECASCLQVPDAQPTNVSAHPHRTEPPSSVASELASLKLWTLDECVRVFAHSVEELSARLASESLLHWDKDDEIALDFVCSAANLRSAVFGIPHKSKFEVSSSTDDR